ncbi:hypothetical protein PSTT_01887, partial [Puccinia striiformis]
TYKINLLVFPFQGALFRSFFKLMKNYHLESESHEHLIQNLLKDLTKVYVTRYESIKDYVKLINVTLLIFSLEKKNPHIKRWGWAQWKTIQVYGKKAAAPFSGFLVLKHNKHNTGLKEAQVQEEKGYLGQNVSLLFNNEWHDFNFLLQKLLLQKLISIHNKLILVLWKPMLHWFQTCIDVVSSLRNCFLQIEFNLFIFRNTSYKHWAWGPFMYREVESEFNTMDVLDHHHSLLEQK